MRHLPLACAALAIPMVYAAPASAQDESRQTKDSGSFQIFTGIQAIKTCNWNGDFATNQGRYRFSEDGGIVRASKIDQAATGLWGNRTLRADLDKETCTLNGEWQSGNELIGIKTEGWVKDLKLDVNTDRFSGSSKVTKQYKTQGKPIYSEGEWTGVRIKGAPVTSGSAVSSGIATQKSSTSILDEKPNCNWQGLFSSGFGSLTFSKHGNLVAGTYADKGHIVGTIGSDCKLSGLFTNKGHENKYGRLTLSLDQQGKTFSGTWGWKDERTNRGEPGTWAGSREGSALQAASASACNWTGQYLIDGLHNYTFTQIGTEVTGKRGERAFIYGAVDSNCTLTAKLSAADSLEAAKALPPFSSLELILKGDVFAGFETIKGKYPPKTLRGFRVSSNRN